MADNLKTVLKKAASKNAGSKGTDLAAELAGPAEECYNLKQKVKGMEDDIKALNQKMLNTLDEAGKEKVRVQFGDGTKHNVTRVQNKPVHVLWEKLRKRIGATKWNSITVRTPDSKLLEAAMATGTIDANIVAECSEEAPGTPYIKIT